MKNKAPKLVESIAERLASCYSPIDDFLPIIPNYAWYTEEDVLHLDMYPTPGDLVGTEELSEDDKSAIDTRIFVCFEFDITKVLVMFDDIPSIIWREPSDYNVQSVETDPETGIHIELSGEINERKVVCRLYENPPHSEDTTFTYNLKSSEVTIKKLD